MSGPLASLEYVLPGGRRGRVFVKAAQIPAVDPKALETELERTFVADDDGERLALLEKALSQPSVIFELYPGEQPPRELHAYVRAPAVSDAPIFACALAPRTVLEAMLDESKGPIFETASLEVIDGEASNASVTAALERWTRRVWPNEKTGLVQLDLWADTADVVARTLQRAFPPRVGVLEASTMAPESFSPEESLVPPPFRGEAA